MNIPRLLMAASAVTLAGFSTLSVAENPILDALQKDDGQVSLIAANDMANIKGAAMQMIQNIASPSVRYGTKEHQVTYKKFGSYTDYSSYQYIGFSYNPQDRPKLTYRGQSYTVTGDTWRADKYSNAGTWVRRNSSIIESHYQAIDPNTLALQSFGFRDAAWNRPISKFTW
jgi:hypothetical protein